LKYFALTFHAIIRILLRRDTDPGEMRCDRRRQNVPLRELRGPNMRNAKRNDVVVRASSNVLSDLGVSNAAEKKTKVRLAVAINQILGKANMSQAAAAKMLGINQPKISALANYRLDGFSVERLLNFLNALGQDIEIVIRTPKTRKTARIHVTAS
jgi:predicted XRE-type DNA-binding protein